MREDGACKKGKRSRNLTQLFLTTLIYWRNADVTRKQVIGLIFASGSLLNLCRIPTFGTDFGLTNLILTLLAFILLAFANVVVFVRADARSKPGREMLKFSRLVIVAWFISLTLFCINLFPALRWFFLLPPLLVALLHSAAAIVILGWWTLGREASHADGCPLPALLLSGGFVMVINTGLLYLFVLDTGTTNFISDQADGLRRILASWLP